MYSEGEVEKQKASGGRREGSIHKRDEVYTSDPVFHVLSPSGSLMRLTFHECQWHLGQLCSILPPNRPRMIKGHEGTASKVHIFNVYWKLSKS